MKLKEITPQTYLCHTSACCPAVFETENNSYVIIGKKTDAVMAGIAHRVGDDEFVIEVPRGMIDGLK